MLVAAKTHALISEYALICDMRLITREYSIVLQSKTAARWVFCDIFFGLIGPLKKKKKKKKGGPVGRVKGQTP